MTAPGAPIGFMGVNATLYYSTVARVSWGGSLTAGRLVNSIPASLTLIKNVRGDVKIPDELSEANMTIRGSNFELTNPALVKLSIDIPMVYDPGAAIDGGYLAMETAKLTGVVIPLLFMDGPDVTGARGLWADFCVFKIEKTEVQDGYQMTQVTVKPALTAVPPQYVQVM